MLTRAWYVLATVWALLITFLAVTTSEGPTRLHAAAAVLPFYVPRVVKAVFGFIWHGPDYFTLRKLPAKQGRR